MRLDNPDNNTRLGASPSSTPPLHAEVRAALDTIQRNIWGRINDEAQKQGIEFTIGQAYALGSVIKEVLHPQVEATVIQAVADALLAALPEKPIYRRLYLHNKERY